MPFVPVPNTAMLEALYIVAGQRCQNTLYFERVDPFDSTLLEELCAQYNGYWDTAWSAAASNEAQFIGSEARALDAEIAPFGANFLSSPQAGALLSPVLPNNVTLAVTFLTGLTGRGNRGRNYWVGLSEGNVTQSTVGTGAITSILSAYNGLNSVAATVDSALVVVSRFLNGSPRVTGVTAAVTGFRVADQFVDSQRRRLPGRGT